MGEAGRSDIFGPANWCGRDNRFCLLAQTKKKFAAKDKLALSDHENVNLLELNVNTADDVDKFFHDHKGSLHDVDILVNNARNPAFLQVKDGEFSTADALLEEYLVDVVLPYRMSVLLARNSSLSVVVNVGSIYGNKNFKERIYDDGWRSAPIQYGLGKSGSEQTN